MTVTELYNGLKEIISSNKKLEDSYKTIIEPVLEVMNKDYKTLYKISGRTPNEIFALDIRTFYTEVNLCKLLEKQDSPVTFINN